jgi:hypothetical protein
MPWTYTDTIGYLDCVVTYLTATPNFYLEDSFYTAVVSGVSFPAQTECVCPDGLNVTTTDTTYIYLTFPQLAVMNLRPGGSITMVCSRPAKNRLLMLRNGHKLAVPPAGIYITPMSPQLR